MPESGDNDTKRKDPPDDEPKIDGGYLDDILGAPIRIPIPDTQPARVEKSSPVFQLPPVELIPPILPESEGNQTPLEVAQATCVGGRGNNEDSCSIRMFGVEITQEPQTTVVMALADGMGGLVNSEIASILAVQEVMEVSNYTHRNQLFQAASQTNKQIIDYNLESDSDSGTTLSAAFLQEWETDGKREYMLHAFNIGDSRIYVVRGGKVAQLTTDDVVNHNGQDYLTAHLGGKGGGGIKNTNKRLFSLPAHPGDIIFLCSDGLTDMQNGGQIGATLAKEGDMAHNVQEAVQRSVQRGGKHGDNVTLVGVRIPNRSERKDVAVTKELTHSDL